VRAATAYALSPSLRLARRPRVISHVGLWLRPVAAGAGALDALDGSAVPLWRHTSSQPRIGGNDPIARACGRGQYESARQRTRSPRGSAGVLGLPPGRQLICAGQTAWPAHIYVHAHIYVQMKSQVGGCRPSRLEMRLHDSRAHFGQPDHQRRSGRAGVDIHVTAEALDPGANAKDANPGAARQTCVR
jgi:hypothetical protein